MNLCSQLPELYVIKYVCSFRVLTYNCTFVHMTTPVLPSMRKERFLFYHVSWVMSYGPPWAHYLGGYQDRRLGGPLELLDLGYTAPVGVKSKDLGGEVLG
jgi:hypothetical protein